MYMKQQSMSGNEQHRSCQSASFRTELIEAKDLHNYLAASAFYSGTPL